MFIRSLFLTCLALALLWPGETFAQKKKAGEMTPAESPINSSLLSGLRFRSVGPALTSGRVADLVVNPQNPNQYYVAVASGGVWKTVNHGTTFEPIFDGQSSYSIGCITLDPNNPNVVWVGTGENNGQRSVAYGDGVYKSLDGGKTWQHVGLKASEHIGMIAVDPRNSDVVYVAAQGPLWSAGGDRGLYKTTDGGETWEHILDISEHTGVNEIHLDPRNPDVMYASAWQRRRKVWTFISGGPESAIYKSEDGGKTWHKSQQGLPSGDLGRIGMDISPVDPDVVYAIVEASEGAGFYRSTDRGASWQKMSGMSTSGNYYQEIIADPVNVDRVFVMDTYADVTLDGGRTFRPVGETHKHVDNHCIWINPQNTDHYLMGCDGGLYETWDNASTWHYKPNLPVTQFYKVAVDNAEPFYHIYGGTQDNFSLGGPSQTLDQAGIVNSDWFVTNGGDGFESAIDPDNPNIVYAQAQYGSLVRYDKASGESVFIQPQPDQGEPGLRWNWDAPLLVSPHQGQRLFFAANKLFVSDDRGDTWRAISGDLSRQLDRNAIPVMGRVWGMDAVAKNRSTTIYGNIVALDESPLVQGLLYVGTDDGLIQISDNLGDTWTTIKTEDLPGIDGRVYVNMLLASQHSDQVVYAALNNHKNGDFKPYLFKSTDRGQSWTRIEANLPERGSVYAIAEDHENPNLLFVGTEFGVFTSLNGGGAWTQLKAGLPTIAVRDLAIQPRENDLVLATFGRGFYVLDDYSPLRELAERPALAEAKAHFFPIAEGLMYVEAARLGLRGKSFQGESYYTADNPEVGAVFTYHLKESIKTREQRRKEQEKKLREAGEDIPYSTFEEMRAEDDEEKPYLLLTVTDAEGNIINRLQQPASAGLHRAVWNFRYPPTTPIELQQREPSIWGPPNQGYLVMPGTYQVSLGKVVDGAYTELTPAQAFEVKSLNHSTLPAQDKEALRSFQEKVSELRRSIRGAIAIRSELAEKVDHIKAAIRQTPTVPVEMMTQARQMEQQLTDMRRTLNGDYSLSRREFETPPSISGRVETIVYGLWTSTSAPTTTMARNYEIAAEEFEPVYDELKALVKEIRAVEEKLEAYGAPYTPGRVPTWYRE